MVGCNECRESISVRHVFLVLRFTTPDAFAHVEQVVVVGVGRVPNKFESGLPPDLPTPHKLPGVRTPILEMNMNRTRNTYSVSFPSHQRQPSSSRLFALRQQALRPVLATMVEIEVEAESVLRFTSKNDYRTKLSSHNIQPFKLSLDVLPPNSLNLIRITAVTVLK